MFLKYLTIGLSLTGAVSGRMLTGQQTTTTDSPALDEGYEKPHNDEVYEEPRSELTQDTEESYSDEVDTEEPHRDSVDTEEPRSDSVDTEEPRSDSVDTEEHHRDSVDTEEPHRDSVDTEEPRRDSEDTEEPRRDSVDTEEPRRDSEDTEEHHRDSEDTEEPHRDSVDTEEPHRDSEDTEDMRPENPKEVYVEQQYYGSPSSPPPPPPRRKGMCKKEGIRCWDDSIVVRIPERGCVFDQCPVKEDEIILCEDWMIENCKKQVKESRCVDDCDCISMFMTSLASLECVIPDLTMEIVEKSHEVYHHCKDEETGESLIKPRQDLLRDTQNTCRSAQCEIQPEIIDKFEKKDAKKRAEAEHNYKVTDEGVTIINVEEDLEEKKEPVRDVDVIFEENTSTRDLINKCLPDCDGALDQSMCEIIERVMTKNCTVVVCDIDPREVEQEILSSCDTFGNKKESIDMMAEFGEFYGSGANSMWSMGFIGGMILARA